MDNHHSLRVVATSFMPAYQPTYLDIYKLTDASLFIYIHIYICVCVCVFSILC